MADFVEEYNRLNKEIEEQVKAGAFAQSNIDNIIDKILIPHYTAQAEMKWQKEYPRGSEEFKKHVEQDVESAKLWINAYISCRKGLETRRPFNNPDDPAWTVMESDLAFANKYYPDVDKNIGKDVTDLNQAFLKHKELTEELEELIAGTKEEETPEPDASQEIANIQEQTQMEVKEITSTPEPEGHTYPVATVKGWTNELKGYNNQLTKFILMFKSINFDKVDRMWLKKQVLKFINWLKDKLDKLKKKIVSGLKGMMQPVKKVMGLLSPILSLPGDPLAILGWAGNVVSFFTEPYTKVIQFISDFTTYTPPLISEATKLAVGVALVPGTINEKAQELTGEGAEVIKEEIANAVAGVAFEPPSMGDLT